MLVGSFPNAGPHDAQGYTRMLIEEIYASEPGACVLESACRRIRRTMKFPPSIAEFLKVLDEEGSRWCNRWEACDTSNGNDPSQWYLQQREWLKQQIAEIKAKQEQKAANPVTRKTEGEPSK